MFEGAYTWAPPVILSPSLLPVPHSARYGGRSPPEAPPPPCAVRRRSFPVFPVRRRRQVVHDVFPSSPPAFTLARTPVPLPPAEPNQRQSRADRPRSRGEIRRTSSAKFKSPPSPPFSPSALCLKPTEPRVEDSQPAIAAAARSSGRTPTTHLRPSFSSSSSPNRT